MMPAVLELPGLYLDQAEHRLQKAIADQPHEHRAQLSELSYLVYESLSRGHFGTGSFNVAITCNDNEFVVSVKSEKG